MNLHRMFFVLALFIFSSCAIKSQKGTTDFIKPVNLEERTTTAIVISDLFYADNYDLEFLPNDNFKLELDSSNTILKITPSESFSGLSLIAFRMNGNEYQIPVKLHKRKKYLFTYKPEGNPESVNLFGQFNGWNRNNLPMSDEDGDGVYQIRVPLDPGRYEYKYYIDGKELIDPENPVKVPNGFGDYNSVIIIEKIQSDKQFLHLLGYKRSDDSITYNFYYESLLKNLLTPADVIALLDNSKIPGQNIVIDGNEISIGFNEAELQGENIIRVAVSKSGIATNFQTVRLKDGMPLGNNGFESWHDAIIYSIMLDRFYDGDTTNNSPVEQPDLSYKANYQGGDLQGLTDKIQRGYFDSLGINTLWVSPIIDNTNNAYREYPPPHRYFTGYHGYWPVSSTKVEEHFGNMKLAQKFVDQAHNHGINVLMDYVANHVHKEHPLWKEHRDWFGVLELPDGRKNLRLWDEYRLTTWFEPYLPSFDYVDSKEALQFMTDNAVWWLKETGVDGFRHDAVKHIPNKFWRTLTKKLKIEVEIPEHKKVYQIGETFGSLKLISSYVNNGQLDAQFNFNLYDVALPVFLYSNNSFELLDLQMQKTFSVYGMDHLMGNVMDSHDKVRYMAYADGDIELNSNDAIEIGWNNPPKVDHPSSYQKLKLHLAYILTIPGVPVIYYGDEIGMTGAADPDNRRMMRFGSSLNQYEKETLKDVSGLIHIRSEHPALRYGDFYTLLANDVCYAFIRSDLNERILVLLNKSNEDQTLELQIPPVYKIRRAVNVQTGESETIESDKLITTVPPIGWKILKLEK
ncbi:neopullulanase [bacterium BMS3Abin03]|nr:neopullulanase [bacterium BMS3Abin03]